LSPVNWRDILHLTPAFLGRVEENAMTAGEVRGEATEPTGRCHLIVEGGLVVDGSGSPAFRADLAVEGGRIAALGELVGWRADQRIDASGLVVAPGFIDVHTHDDLAALREPDFAAKVSQGVTTVIAGNCGISLAPFERGDVLPPPVGMLGSAADFAYPSLAAYREALARARPALNIAMLTGHGMLRVEALGEGYERSAEPLEIEAMAARLGQALDEGSLGLSTGLGYPNSRAASTEEVLALARTMAGREDVLYVSHMRDEGDHVLEAIDETLTISAGADVPAVISHHKCAGPRPWRGSKRRRRANPSGSTSIPTPPPRPCCCRRCCARPRMSSSLIRRAIRRPAVAAWPRSPPEAGGRRLAEVADEFGCSEAEAAERLAPAGAIYFQMDEGDLRRILAYPRTMIGSDGLPGSDHPHPRLWGTFPRVLGRYVRGEGLLTLQEAVRRMTGLSADTFRLRDRGYLRPGAVADLVLFDADRIEDRATFAEPKTPAAGIHLVLVNGKSVWRDGAPTGERPGGFLARGTHR
jgi:N-acyl-D-amino-acid deacylase